MTKPIVAIVGRPNVGKSTLFNRLVGQRLAIVQDLPETTRDRVYADISWNGRELTIVDTGGLELEPHSTIRQKVRDQAHAAIEEADAIVFLVDVTEGITLTDQELTESLRRSRKPVVVGVTKADNDQRRMEAFQFHELGMGSPLPLSALHGTGVDDLMDEVCSQLPPSQCSEPQPDMLRIAIVGRPNVGKSMLLNALVGRERAIVSETPGTTRDAVDTIVEGDAGPVMFIDTAGIRRRGKIEPGIERYSVMRALRAVSRADVALLVVEAGEPLTAQDAHIAGYVQEALRGMVLVVNKWDLADSLGLDAADLTNEIQYRLKFFPAVPILFVSALTGDGIRNVLPAARTVREAQQIRVPTAEVNEVVKRVVAAHSPPSVRGRQLKVSYATQAESDPPVFVFFVNDPTLLHFSYQRYLENRLREEFGFRGVPLKLIFKRKGKDDRVRARSHR